MAKSVKGMIVEVTCVTLQNGKISITNAWVKNTEKR